MRARSAASDHAERPAWLLVTFALILGSVIPEDSKPADEKIDPNPHHKQTGEQAHPGIQRFRDDVLRRKERDQTQGKHAQGMGDRRGQTQIDRMLHRAARTDQIRADNRFAVTGRHGMHRTPDKRNSQCQ